MYRIFRGTLRDQLTRRRRGGREAALVEALEARIKLSIYTVSTLVDSGAGSLRQAILDANASAGADEIVFDASFYAGPHTIVIDSAPPQINQQLKITGPGSSLLTIQRSGGGPANSRHAFNSFASELTLTGMTVTGGTISGAGGGLSAVGVSPNVTLDDVVFSGNSADGLGGAIYMGNNASLTIRNSVITGNSALSGGGIYFVSGGSLLMENTTVIGNKANASANATGGGLYFDATALASPPPGYTPNTLVIRNSTFTNNVSNGIGGGIELDTLTGTLQLQNSTISGNTAAISGGGIAATSASGAILLQDSTITLNTASGTNAANGGGGIFRASILNNTLTIVNSIVSGNTNANGPDIRTDGFTTTHVNYCAIGSGMGFMEAADSGNNIPFSTNLKLDILANNGGPTKTHAILAGSPLINAGLNSAVPSGVTTDQRGAGFGRINDSVVDIGAYETVSVGPAVSSPQFNYLTAPQSLQFTFSEDVKGSLSVSDLLLKNLTTNSVIPAANLSLNYAANNVATFTFHNYPYNALPDGNYRATLTAAGISDTGGHPLSSDYTFDFFFLNGDANRDRSVGFADLVAVAQNYGMMSGGTFAKGDFTYDGKVDFADLVIVAQKYGTSLPVVAPLDSSLSEESPSAADVTTAPKSIESLFSLKPSIKAETRNRGTSRLNRSN